MERLHAQLTDEAHAAVVADIDALRSSAARVSELGNANMTMASFVDDVAPPLTVLAEGAIAMLAIEKDWMRARAAASETLSAGMSGLRAFVAQQEEVGRKDSERSANLSVAAKIFGELLAVAGGLTTVDNLRGPLSRVPA